MLNYVYVVYGPAVIEHSLLVTDILPNSKIGKDIDAGKGLFKKKSYLMISDYRVSGMLAWMFKQT